MGANIEYSAKLREEIGILKHSSFPLTAELLVSASEPTEGSSSSAEQPEADAAETGNGHWMGTSGVLLPVDETDRLVRELRERSASASDATESEELLSLWITAEPCLSPSELDDLRSAVFARFFGEYDERVTSSRNSSDAQGGGH